MQFQPDDISRHAVVAVEAAELASTSDAQWKRGPVPTDDVSKRVQKAVL